MNDTNDTNDSDNRDELVEAIKRQFMQALYAALKGKAARFPRMSAYIRRYGNGDPRVAADLRAWLADLCGVTLDPDPDPDPDADGDKE